MARYWEKHPARYDTSMQFLDRVLIKDGRTWVCSRASGETLEVGIGTGLNIPLYPKGVRLTGLTSVRPWCESPGVGRVAQRLFVKCDTSEMPNQIASHAESRGDHWDATYRRGTPTQLSWHQPEPTVPLELIESLAVARDGAVIDIGGGASTLVDRLLGRGFLDVSVLDVSAAALALTRERLGHAQGAQLVQADILSWQPTHCYNLWHDRAVFHFLVDLEDRQRYIDTLFAAVCSGCHVIIGTFAPDGPERCSGLPVVRYSADDLASVLMGRFEIVAVRREDHITPAGTTQPFTWVAARALH